MHLLPKKPYILLITILLLFILYETVLLLKPKNGAFSQSQPLDPKEINFTQARSLWQEKIASLGPQKAFAAFKQQYSSLDPNTQHSLAHIFGEVLYKQIGIDGITTCDASFSFGCYHSFFGSAIADKGPAIVQSLNKACLDKYGPLGTGCQHGIGHGAMEYYGGSRVKEALALCSKIQSIPLLGCSSGVFMEYNFPTIVSGQQARTTTRALDNAPDRICTQIDTKFQPSCYFELSSWLAKNYKSYQKTADFCSRLEGQNKVDCLRGLGNTIAADKNYTLKIAVPVCRSLTEEEEKVYCLAGEGWAFFAMPPYHNSYQQVCTDLPQQDKTTCLRLADLTKESL